VIKKSKPTQPRNIPQRQEAFNALMIDVQNGLGKTDVGQEWPEWGQWAAQFIPNDAMIEYKTYFNAKAQQGRTWGEQNFREHGKLRSARTRRRPAIVSQMMR
jgi:hypothetical protein